MPIDETEIKNIQSLLQQSNNNSENLTIAENLCQELIISEPQDPRALQMLSFIQIKTNRLLEAVITLKKIIALLPEAARQVKCLNDIGELLNKIGDKEQAISYLNKAIEIMPNYAPAHYNLGIIYTENKDFKKSIEHYKQAIKADPNFAMAYNNLAQNLAHSSSTLKEALDYQKKAVELLPTQIVLKQNLALIQFQYGDFKEALSIFNQIVEANQLDWRKWERILDIYYYLRDQTNLSATLTKLLSLINKKETPANSQKRIYFLLTLTAFLTQDYKRCEHYLNESSYLYIEPDNDDKIKWARVFFEYFRSLINFFNSHPDIYKVDGNEENIYIIGESHSLSPAHVTLEIDSKKYKIIPEFISGCKIWHIISPYSNQFKSGFEILLNQLDLGSKVIICLGEIDCRIDTGIMPYYRKNPTINLAEHIQLMAKSYIEFLVEQASPKELQLIIQGIPACNRDISSYPIEEQQTFLQIIKDMNDSLKAECAARNLKFLDVYSLTASDNGISNGKYHIDGHHLKPHYILELL